MKIVAFFSTALLALAATPPAGADSIDQLPDVGVGGVGWKPTPLEEATATQD